MRRLGSGVRRSEGVIFEVSSLNKDVGRCAYFSEEDKRTGFIEVVRGRPVSIKKRMVAYAQSGGSAALGTGKQLREGDAGLKICTYVSISSRGQLQVGRFGQGPGRRSLVLCHIKILG